MPEEKNVSQTSSPLPQEMPSNVKMARICLIISGCLYIVITLFSCLFFSISLFGADKLYGITMGILLLILFVVGGGMAVLNLLTAKGISNKKGWARIVGIILAAIYIPSLFIILGILMLVGLLGQDAESWFK